MVVAFVLSMPNIGSWNGKWTGEDSLYARVRNIPKEKVDSLLKKAKFYYDFGDGWGASVAVKAVSASEATKIRKKSKGFYGYDWMIESILQDGNIHT